MRHLTSMAETEQAHPSDTMLNLMKKNSEMERELKELKLRAGTTEMKLGIADRKLVQIEEHLASIAPLKAGEVLADRVKRVLDELQELKQQNAALRDMRGDRDAHRTRWRQIADSASPTTALAPKDAPSRATAAARYADQLLEEEGQRFHEVTLPSPQPVDPQQE